MRFFGRMVIIFISIILISCSNNDRSTENHTSGPNKTLTIESSIQDIIETGNQHEYFFDLTANRFVLIRAVRGSFAIGEEVNLELTIRDPSGDIIEHTNTASGSSLITLFSGKAGRYSIEVGHWNGADRGNYSLHIDIDEPAATTKLGKINQLLRYVYSPTRPGAVMAIIDKGDAVLVNAYGLADIDSNKPLTPDTSIELASLSKQFTAYAIALLVSKDQISMTDSIGSIISELSPMADDMTVHQLVHHLSGLRDYEEVLGDSERSRDNILKTIYRQDDGYFPIGSNYRYSNGGYVLLAELVERLTNDSFGNWIKSQIFMPLGMQNTFVPGSRNAPPFATAKSYKKREKGYDDIDVPLDVYEEIVPNLEAIGAAHVHASLNDMIKWAGNYRDNKIGGEVVSTLIDDGIIDEEQEWDYLFGLKQYKDRGLLRRGHEGLTHGFRTMFAWYPDNDVVFIYLANDGEWRTFYLAEKIIDIYLGNQMVPKDFKN